MEKNPRVLSLDIRPQRIGYVVLEADAHLLDWGVMRLRASRDHADRVEFLLNAFQPSVLVLRRITRGSIRDRAVVRRASRRIQRKAEFASIPSVFVGRMQIIWLFHQHVRPTKQEIASLIAGCFAELAWRLPPGRKVWEPEHWNMCLFDSVALGLTYFAQHVDAEAITQLLREGAESFRRPLGGVAI